MPKYDPPHVRHCTASVCVRGGGGVILRDIKRDRYLSRCRLLPCNRLIVELGGGLLPNNPRCSLWKPEPGPLGRGGRRLHLWELGTTQASSLTVRMAFLPACSGETARAVSTRGRNGDKVMLQHTAQNHEFPAQNCESDPKSRKFRQTPTDAKPAAENSLLDRHMRAPMRTFPLKERADNCTGPERPLKANPNPWHLLLPRPLLG